MESVTDISMIETIHDLFWHRPFYVVLYVVCLLSLVLFWKTMERGRRCFFAYSLICLIIFVYNPVFINLCEQYLLRGQRVIARIILILPLLFNEAYVFANIVSSISKKNKILSYISALIIVFMLVVYGNMPWQGAIEGTFTYDTPMIIMGENLYKIPQEHIDIVESIFNDMDGERATLSMYELHGINDVGGTLNFSIRMYTSRIQLRTVIGTDVYNGMTEEERVAYWNDYMNIIQDGSTDNSSYYFLMPIGDERADDLITYGCVDLPVDSSNYRVLVYSPI